MVKVALLVGVSEYELGLNPLPAAVKDVEALQHVLLNPNMGGFVQTDVTLLKNPDRQQLEEAIEHLFSSRQKDDLVLFFFSGHGIKDDSGRLYLATRRTCKNSSGALMRSSAVSANFVQERMDESRSRRQVVILDCCYSGAFAKGLSIKDDGTVNIREQLGGEGRAILTSSTSTQQSFEQEGSNLSIYTQYLIEGIKTGAADIDDDGFISIDELHEYAKNKVRETHSSMSPEIYAIREGFKIRLTKVPLLDPQQKYKKEMVRYVNYRGDISFVGRNILNLLKERLELSFEEVTAIETEVLADYRQDYREKIKQYEQVFTQLIKDKSVITDAERHDLQKFQQSLHLNDEDTTPVEQQVIAAIEAYRKNLQFYEQELFKTLLHDPTFSKPNSKLQQIQQQLQLSNQEVVTIQTRISGEVQAYKQKLHQYETLFWQATQKEYPLHESTYRELQQQQQFLGLTDEDVAPIQTRISTEVQAYKQKLQQYEALFLQAIQREYPLSDLTCRELQRQQQLLGLTDEDIAPIQTRISTEVQAYKQKRQQYETLFLQCAQEEFPLSESTHRKLQQQQQLLGLTHEDTAPIQARIGAQIEDHHKKLQQYEQVLNNVIQTEYPIGSKTREELQRFQQVLELSSLEVSVIEERVFRKRTVVQTELVPKIETQDENVSPIPAPPLTAKSRTSIQGRSATFTISPHFLLILLLISGLVGLLSWQQNWFSLLAGKVTIPNSGDILPSSPDNSNNPIGEDARVIVTNRQESFRTSTSPQSIINVPAGSILREIPPQLATANNPANSGSYDVYLKVCSVGVTPEQSNSSAPAPNDLVVPDASPRPKKPLLKGQTVKIDASKYKDLNFPQATQTQRKQCQPQSSKPKTSPESDSSGETEAPVPTASTQPKPTTGIKNSSEQ